MGSPKKKGSPKKQPSSPKKPAPDADADESKDETKDEPKTAPAKAGPAPAPVKKHSTAGKGNVDPKALGRWGGADGEALHKAVLSVIPACFMPGPPPRAVHTPEIQWMTVFERISAIMGSYKERRRFILHYPKQPPFSIAVMFDVADPIKAASAGCCPRAEAGAPFLCLRYRRHDPSWTGDESKAAVIDFYRRQRDGFINPEAAVVPPADSIVGLESPTPDAIAYALELFEANGARLTKDFAKLFADSPLEPTFIVPTRPDLSKVCVGAHVRLKGMKTPGYDGLLGHVLGRARDGATDAVYTDRWAVMPTAGKMAEKAVELRLTTQPDLAKGEPLRPLAIRESSLVVAPEAAPADVEEAD